MQLAAIISCLDEKQLDDIEALEDFSDFKCPFELTDAVEKKLQQVVRNRIDRMVKAMSKDKDKHHDLQKTLFRVHYEFLKKFQEENSMMFTLRPLDPNALDLSMLAPVGSTIDVRL